MEPTILELCGFAPGYAPGPEGDLRSSLLIAESERDRARAALVEAGEFLQAAFAARDQARRELAEAREALATVFRERDQARGALAALRGEIRAFIEGIEG